MVYGGMVTPAPTAKVTSGDHSFHWTPHQATPTHPPHSRHKLGLFSQRRTLSQGPLFSQGLPCPKRSLSKAFSFPGVLCTTCSPFPTCSISKALSQQGALLPRSFFPKCSLLEVLSLAKGHSLSKAFLSRRCVESKVLPLEGTPFPRNYLSHSTVRFAG